MTEEQQSALLLAAYDVIAHERFIERLKEDIAELENPRRRGVYAFEKRAHKAKRDLPAAQEELSELKSELSALTPMSARKAVNEIRTAFGALPRFSI